MRVMRRVSENLWMGLLVIAFLLVVTPQVVFAEDTQGVYGGDISSTGFSMDLTADGEAPTEKTYYKAGDGTVTFTPAPTDAQGKVTGAAVLTLDNASIHTTADGNKHAIRLVSSVDVEIQVIGNNSLITDGAYASSLYLMEKNISQKVEPEVLFTLTGGGTLGLEANGSEGDAPLYCWADLYIDNVILNVSGGEDWDCSQINVPYELTIENATIAASSMEIGSLYMKSGNLIGVVPCVLGDLKLDSGAVLEMGCVGIFANVEDTEISIADDVDVLLFFVENDGNNVIEPKGDVILPEYMVEYISNPYISAELNIPEGSSLTIPEGIELDLTQSNVSFDIGGNLIVNGTVTFPDSLTAEDIASMSLSGTGVVKISGTEQIYTTDGSALQVVDGLDFTNVGDGEGQTPATGNGYVWDANTSSLTLNAAYISGNLNLPANSVIILSGVSFVAGEIQVNGEVSDAFTISGEGTLTSADGARYVSHSYGEPQFTWTKEADGIYCVIATFVCVGGENTQTIDATVEAIRKDAGCETDGEIVYVAKVTFEETEYTDTKKETIPAIGHTWDAGVVTKQPTTMEDGERTYTCSGCNKTKVEAIAALGAPKQGTIIKDEKNTASYKITKAGVKNGTVEYVKPVKKSAKTVTIPATIQADGITYKVTSIAKNAFKNNTKVTTVKIGSNVKTIGANAFYGCKKLSKVTLGKNVATIGDKAFYKCTALTKITIPSKVSKIGKQAFYGCKKLKSITIKTTKLTKKKVGSKAFKGINSTARIKVPKSKLKAYKTLLKSKGVGSKTKIS